MPEPARALCGGTFDRRFAGSVLVRGDAGYDEARSVPSGRFRSVRPDAVVLCADSSAAAALHAAEQAGRSISVPSGGHCFAGRSSSGDVVLSPSTGAPSAAATGRQSQCPVSGSAVGSASSDGATA